jgi:regulator of sigma E protease
MGIIYLLQFTALLSVNLAVINFLPFPALDGGRILFLLIEKIRRKPVSQKIENLVHNIGFSLLMLLVLLVTYRDVIKFSDKFVGLWDKIIK